MSRNTTTVVKMFMAAGVLVIFPGCESNTTYTGTSTGTSDTSAPASLQELSVSSTDSAIQYNPGDYHLYRECDNGSCADDLLFVFFPGSDGDPSGFTQISAVIGETGIRVLVLAYQNNGSLNSICGTNDTTSDDCYTNARENRIVGATSSPYVDSVADGVDNRLLKALQSLGWTSFYTGNSINWSKIIVGGFSQGAGIAAWIGKHELVDRVCQFSGTWDYYLNAIGSPISASWLSGSSVTPESSFYGFDLLNDSMTNGANYLNINWETLGMGTNPIELYTNGLTGQKIYADDESDSGCVADFHGCSVADSATPILSNGTPMFASVWKYVCGR